MDPNLKAGLFIAAGLLLLFVFFYLVVRWARTRSKGALAAGAILSMFAPDPELEKNIRLAEESRQEQHEEDEEGEDRNPRAGARD
jgi:hypothetical protein